MHSYIREFSSGLGFHNLITTFMAEHNLGLQDALNWLGTYNDAIVSRFLSNLKRVPSWDLATDRRVQIYIDGLGQCNKGLDDWSFESKRYYGDDGPTVRRDRIIRISQSSKLPWLDLEEIKAEKTKETKPAPKNRGEGSSRESKVPAAFVEGCRAANPLVTTAAM